MGSATQSPLPASGRGWNFKGLAGGNADATDHDAGDRLTTVLSDAPTGDFTIELFAHQDVIQGGFGSSLAGSAVGNQNAEVGWLLQDRSGALSLTMCGAAGCEVVSSGIGLAAGVDYYLAASWDQDGDATFYVQDLTNGGALQVATVAHTLSSYNPFDTFAIGALPAGNLILPTDGLLDEVRLSDMVLAADELFIVDWVPPSLVPAPAGAWLVGAGAIVLGLRRGRGGA